MVTGWFYRFWAFDRRSRERNVAELRKKKKRNNNKSKSNNKAKKIKNNKAKQKKHNKDNMDNPKSAL